MDIRPAREADALAIETIRVRGWQAGYRNVFPPERLDEMTIDERRWRLRLAHPPTGWIALVAEVDGIVAGFAVSGPSEGRPEEGELHALYVDPKQWSSGIGRALLEGAEAELARAYSEATLWVLEDNPRARGFYERCGWMFDGAWKKDEWLGVRAQTVRYRKPLSNSRSSG
jgi:GNAT superfamily N-acetyltransferase